MARDGKLELQQLAPFAEIFIRDRPANDLSPVQAPPIPQEGA